MQYHWQVKLYSPSDLLNKSSLLLLHISAIPVEVQSYLAYRHYLLSRLCYVLA